MFLYILLDSKGVLIPGLLDYLIDGVIPFLHIYYCSYFNPTTAIDEEKREKEYAISINIARNMIVSYAPKLPKHVNLSVLFFLLILFFCFLDPQEGTPQSLSLRATCSNVS